MSLSQASQASWTIWGHLRTTDGGLTWHNVSGNLPNIPVNAIVIDPVLANTYYVATDIGVFRTRNGGGFWSVLGAGLPRVTVLGLTLHNPSRTLRAATHGRSMWDIHVPIADLNDIRDREPQSSATRDQSQIHPQRHQQGPGHRSEHRGLECYSGRNYLRELHDECRDLHGASARGHGYSQLQGR